MKNLMNEDYVKCLAVGFKLTEAELDTISKRFLTSEEYEYISECEALALEYIAKHIGLNSVYISNEGDNRVESFIGIAIKDNTKLNDFINNSLKITEKIGSLFCIKKSSVVVNFDLIKHC